MRDYIYILNLVSKYQDEANWGEKEEKTLQEHSDRLERQSKRGTVKYVGRTDLPISNDANFGLVVFEAESDTMAELFAQADPAVMGGMMTVKCLPFKKVF
jgi:uncharacterized protein YciI